MEGWLQFSATGISNASLTPILCFVSLLNEKQISVSWAPLGVTAGPKSGSQATNGELGWGGMGLSENCLSVTSPPPGRAVGVL
jgi:hypothetical protein